MNSLQAITDKAAIGLSFLCLAHCFALPAILVLLPSLAALNLENEAFHLWMVGAVLPTSLYALTIGCKQHKRYTLLAYGAAGISFLILALLTEELLGELGETLLTSLGAIVLAFGHYKNYRLCQASKEHNPKKHSNCSCPQETA